MVGLTQLEAKMMAIEHHALEQPDPEKITTLHREVEEALAVYIPILSEDLEKMKKIIGVA